MPKQLHISVAESCHENWDGMQPNQLGRHCLSCQKTVVDFTNMTDAELINFFTKNNNGDTCGRFHNDQLQRAIPIPKKQVHWMKYFFKFTLPAFFLSTKANAQGDTTKPAIEIVDTTKPVQTDSIIGPGTAADSVAVKAYDSAALHDSLLSSIGDWYLEPITVMPNTTNWQLMPTTTGYCVTQMRPVESITISFLDTLTSLSGQLVNKLINGVKPLSAPPPLPNIPSQTFITLFPSPIKPTGTLHVNLEDADIGQYLFAIANNAGSIFQEGSFEITENKATVEIPLLQLPADDYLLTLTHKASKETFSQTFIVA